MRTSNLTRGVAAALALALFPAAAPADEAVATTHLNVRTGPGPGYARVDTLFPGEVVEMTECQPSGWCFITHDGPDGWVSSRYLTGAPAAGPLGGDCRFELRITPDGPEFGIVCGRDPGPGGGDGGGGGPGEVVPTGNQACFYDLPNFAGDSFCRGVTTLGTLPAAANDRITSVRISGDVGVRLCRDPDLGGFCRNITASEGQLGPVLDNQVSSLQVFRGLPPGAAPPVLSSGTVTLPNTRRLNLDTGAVGMAGADLWYRVHDPVVPRLATMNGARIATPAGPVTGYRDCDGASYGPGPLRMADFPSGSTICVRTSEGHTALVRRDAASPVDITLSYRTFAD